MKNLGFIMKKAVYILILIGLLSSCQESLKSDKKGFCNEMKELAQKEIEKGNIEPVLRGKYLFSETDKYFIWKKYGVNIIYPIHLNEYYQKELDSCYNSIMLSHTPNKIEIINDLDSLTMRIHKRSKYEFPKSKYIREYHDGKFYVGANAKNKNFAPKRIDKSYYDKLDEFKTKFTSELTDTIKCEFWYEIDTFGLVQNIEIYHHANPIIDAAVIDFYSSFNYIPANDGINKLEFRGEDVIYFLGTMTK